MIFYQLLSTSSVGNEYGQQMRIQILKLGFKGLTYPQFDYKSHIMALDYWGQLSEVLKQNHVFPRVSSL